jgi:hypothetical protein
MKKTLTVVSAEPEKVDGRHIKCPIEGHDGHRIFAMHLPGHVAKHDRLIREAAAKAEKIATKEAGKVPVSKAAEPESQGKAPTPKRRSRKAATADLEAASVDAATFLDGGSPDALAMAL